jgi:hypothetical protein
MRRREVEAWRREQRILAGELLPYRTQELCRRFLPGKRLTLSRPLLLSPLRRPAWESSSCRSRCRSADHGVGLGIWLIPTWSSVECWTPHSVRQ